MPIPVSPEVRAALEELSNVVIPDEASAAYCGNIDLTMSYQDYATLIALLNEKKISIGSGMDEDWEYNNFSSDFYRHKYAKKYILASNQAAITYDEDTAEKIDMEVCSIVQKLEYPPALIADIEATDFSASELTAENFIPPLSVLQERKTIHFGLTRSDATAIQEIFFPLSPSSTGSLPALSASQGSEGSALSGSSVTIASRLIANQLPPVSTPRAKDATALSSLASLPPIKGAAAGRRHHGGSAARLWREPPVSAAKDAQANCSLRETRYGPSAAELRRLAEAELIQPASKPGCK